MLLRCAGRGDQPLNLHAGDILGLCGMRRLGYGLRLSLRDGNHLVLQFLFIPENSLNFRFGLSSEDTLRNGTFADDKVDAALTPDSLPVTEAGDVHPMPADGTLLFLAWWKGHVKLHRDAASDGEADCFMPGDSIWHPPSQSSEVFCAEKKRRIFRYN